MKSFANALVLITVIIAATVLIMNGHAADIRNIGVFLLFVIIFAVL